MSELNTFGALTRIRRDLIDSYYIERDEDARDHAPKILELSDDEIVQLPDDIQTVNLLREHLNVGASTYILKSNAEQFTKIFQRSYISAAQNINHIYDRKLSKKLNSQLVEPHFDIIDVSQHYLEKIRLLEEK